MPQRRALVERVEVLVHPTFVSLPFEKHYLRFGGRDKPAKYGRNAYEEAHGAWMDSVKALARDRKSLLVIVPDAHIGRSLKSLKSPVKGKWQELSGQSRELAGKSGELIRTAQRRLRDRLFVLSRPSEEKVASLVAARGISLHENATVTSYGIYGNLCAKVIGRKIARGLERHKNFSVDEKRSVYL